jgi:hypothetical protein
MRKVYGVDPLFLWWCPGCPIAFRWKAMTTTAWLKHVEAHIHHPLLDPSIDEK